MRQPLPPSFLSFSYLTPPLFLDLQPFQPRIELTKCPVARDVASRALERPSFQIDRAEFHLLLLLLPSFRALMQLIVLPRVPFVARNLFYFTPRFLPGKYSLPSAEEGIVPIVPRERNKGRTHLGLKFQDFSLIVTNDDSVRNEFWKRFLSRRRVTINRNVWRNEAAF